MKKDINLLKFQEINYDSAASNKAKYFLLSSIGVAMIALVIVIYLSSLKNLSKLTDENNAFKQRENTTQSINYEPRIKNSKIKKEAYEKEISELQKQQFLLKTGQSVQIGYLYEIFVYPNEANKAHSELLRDITKAPTEDDVKAALETNNGDKEGLLSYINVNEKGIEVTSDAENVQLTLTLDFYVLKQIAGLSGVPFPDVTDLTSDKNAYNQYIKYLNSVLKDSVAHFAAPNTMTEDEQNKIKIAVSDLKDSVEVVDADTNIVKNKYEFSVIFTIPNEEIAVKYMAGLKKYIEG